MKYVTIIPARGGSKRFPGKNIYPLEGKPLLAHSIEYSKRCPSIAATYVSTDSVEIKQLSRQNGAEVIDRPDEFAGDYATTASAMSHAVKFLDKQGIDFEFVVLLQPTNPLRPVNLLNDAINIIERGINDSLFTVTRTERKLGRITDEHFVPWNYTFGQRSQDLEPLYYENGLLYISSKQLLKQGVIEGPKAYPLIVSHPYGEVDIDTLDDIRYAEYILKKHVER